jgi:hypothetical protein
MHEAFGVAKVGFGEDRGAGGSNLGCMSIVDVVRGVVGDPGVPVIGVVPGVEGAGVLAGVFEAAEPVGEVGPVLQGLELRFAERVVICMSSVSVRNRRRCHAVS